MAATLRRLVLLPLAAATFTCGPPQRIVVGSKNFTESEIPVRRSFCCATVLGRQYD